MPTPISETGQYQCNICKKIYSPPKALMKARECEYVSHTEGMAEYLDKIKKHNEVAKDIFK